MAQIKQEQGRSMVEMLGTLAIIGVLSVGGIAGYTYAMNKYYTNEILAGASARAVIVASQIASGREPSLSEFDKMETAGGDFDGTVKRFDDGLGIKVSGVKETVCKNLIKSIEDTDIGIETEAGGEVTCGDENSFYITFASMGDGGSVSCPTCEATNQGECGALGGTWRCEWEGHDRTCICIEDIDDTERWACSGNAECISCPSGEVAYCSEYGGVGSEACVCVPKNASDDIWACDWGRCIVCSGNQKAHCAPDGEGDGLCVCIDDDTPDDSWTCGGSTCIKCSSDEKAQCSPWGSPGLNTGNLKYDSCVCVPSGYDYLCNDYDCVICPRGQTPICDGDWGKCSCS